MRRSIVIARKACVQTITRRTFFANILPIRVVNQQEVAFREFMGQDRTRIGPGLCFKLPVLHKFTRVDTRETGASIENLTAMTQDNVQVVATGTLFFRVIDPEKAVYEIDNYWRAIHRIGESAVRTAIGKFDYERIASDRNAVNTQLQISIEKAIQRWGIECTKFEIQKFEPMSAEMSKALERQMEADRKKRENDLFTQARIRTSEGEKASAILKSEGELAAQSNKAKGDRIIAEQQADAEKYRIETVTKAMTLQLEELTKRLGDSTLAAKYILEVQKMQNLGKIADGKNNATYFMPNDSTYPHAKVFGDLFGNVTGTSLAPKS